MTDFAAGMVIGGYALEERLGAGGFGEVWRARSLAADACPSTVAVKLARGPEAVAALRREGALQSKLDHPGIVKVLGQAPFHDPPYVVFEHCPLGSLRDAMRGDWSLAGRGTALRPLFRGILEALAHAHGRGVVHGDLKPENVVFDASGRPKLTDFGLGTTVAGGCVQLSHSLASVEKGGGTLAYLPPERFTGGAPDKECDVWAFGVMLFEATFGRLPQGLEDPGFPLGHVFERCYAPRYKRAHSARELLPHLEAPPLPHLEAPPPAPEWPGPVLRPFGMGWAVAGIGAVLAFLAGVALVVVAGDRPRRGPQTRWAHAASVAASARPPSSDAVEGWCRRAAAAMVGAQPGASLASQRQAAPGVAAEMQAAEAGGYRLDPRPPSGIVRAEPRHAGWPTYVLDAQGVLHGVVR